MHAMADEAQEAEDAPIEIVEDDDDALDRARGTGVGVEDPNIVGDVGPTDVPPGRDHDSGLIVTADDDEDPHAEV